MALYLFVPIKIRCLPAFCKQYGRRPITGDVVLAGTTGMLQGAVLSLLILYSYGEKPKLLRHVVTKQAILMGFILLRDS